MLGLGKDRPSVEDLQVDISRVIPDVRPKMPAVSDAPARDKGTSADSQKRASISVAELTADPAQIDFMTWARKDVDRLSGAWQILKTEPESTEALAGLLRAAHDLKGMGGTYGYPALSRLGGSLEKLLKISVWTDHKPLIEFHIASCQTSVKKTPDGSGLMDDVTSAVCHELEAQVQKVSVTSVAS